MAAILIYQMCPCVKKNMNLLLLTTNQNSAISCSLSSWTVAFRRTEFIAMQSTREVWYLQTYRGTLSYIECCMRQADHSQSLKYVCFSQTAFYIKLLSIWLCWSLIFMWKTVVESKITITLNLSINLSLFYVITILERYVDT